MSANVALVTGANKGIGFEIARGLGQLDYTVLAGARDAERGARACAELRAEGLDVRYLPLDVTAAESVAAAAARIADEFGVLDVLVNNAGITDTLDRPPSQTRTAAMREVYEVNVFGVVTVTNAMLPLLRAAAAGRIVNVSSNLSSLSTQLGTVYDLPLLMPYASSKTALNALTVQYGRELADTGIKVNSCAPGKCATDLNNFTSERTPAQGAKIAIALSTLDSSGPTAGFFSDVGEVPW